MVSTWWAHGEHMVLWYYAVNNMNLANTGTHVNANMYMYMYTMYVTNRNYKTYGKHMWAHGDWWAHGGHMVSTWWAHGGHMAN